MLKPIGMGLEFGIQRLGTGVERGMDGWRAVGQPGQGGFAATTEMSAQAWPTVTAAVNAANILCPLEGVCVQGRLNCSLLKSPPPLGSLCIDTWLFFYHSPSMLSDLPCSTSPECPSGEIHTPHSKQALEGLWGPQEFCEYRQSHTCSLLPV